MYKVYIKSNNIYFLDEPAIAYRNHSKSITAKHTHKQLFDLIDFYWNLDISDLYKNGHYKLIEISSKTAQDSNYIKEFIVQSKSGYINIILQQPLIMNIYFSNL